VIPVALKLLWEFVKYFRSQGERGWLPFFIWTNLSVIVFLLAPVIDKWFFVVGGVNEALQ
jgi:heme o synthase